MNPQGARPKDLHRFLNKPGIPIRDNYLRAELNYLAKKGIVIKRGRRYRIRDDIKLKDIESLVDLNRAWAGKAKWGKIKSDRNWKPKHSVNVYELLRKNNNHNLRKYIKSLIRKNELRALATLIALGGGLRPSDYPIEIGCKYGRFYAIIYEPKCDRYRLITEEHDVLWRELLKDEEIRDWLARLLNNISSKHHRSDDDWMKLWAAYIDKKLRSKARRIYSAYQSLYYGSAQARVLTTLNGK